jgi:tight adherence protein B
VGAGGAVVMRRCWIVAAAFISAAAVLVPAAAATAPAPPQIQVTTIGREPFPDRGYVVDLPKAASVRGQQVHVTENRLGVGNFTFQPLSTSGVRYGTILVIDASDSMAGNPEQAAFRAARRFVARRGANELIGILVFNGHTTALAAPTQDADRLNAALATAPPLAYGTHIYDGLQAALAMLADAKVSAGAVVLLSDGADVGSTASKKAVVQAARDQHVRIFTVGLHSGAFDRSALKALGSQTSGAYAEATPAALGPVFAALSTRLATEYLLQYRSAAAPKSDVDVSVSIDGVGVGTAAYTAPTPSGLAPYHTPFIRRFVLSPISLVLVSLLAAWLFAFGLRTFLRSSQTHVVERVGAFSGGANPGAKKQSSEEWRKRATRARSSGSAVARGWIGRLEEQLDIGRINMSAGRIIFLTVLATVVAVALLSLVSTVFMLAGFATPLVTRSFVRRKVAAQRDAFADQLPPNLQVLASALRAGHTLVGALSTTVEHADEPSKTELQRILADEQLGVPLEQAIRTAARRMASRDLEQLALLAELQRTAGGNAAEVLDVIVFTVRERADVRRLVKTLTAQGRMARWILTGLPIVTALGFWVIQPDIVGDFWRSHGGQVALLIAAIMVASGSMVISRIVDIEV